MDPTWPGPTRRNLQSFLLAGALCGTSGFSLAASPQGARQLTVAVAQMQSLDGEIDANLVQAGRLAAAARAEGAELILFPELMPTGYALNETIWQAAEPRRGKTARWLSQTSQRLGCSIGTSFLEAEGEDFFNTFLLTGPDGRELGRVRKETPASLEAAFFKGDAGTRRIEAPFGAIGVGICFESYLCSLDAQLAAARPDIILLPHSFPGIAAVGPRASPPGTHVAQYYASRFGVPALMSNKTGAWSTTTPGGDKVSGWFPGASAIVDSDGRVLARMDDQPGVAVSVVTLDPAQKVISATRPACAGEYVIALAGPFMSPDESPVMPPPDPAKMPSYANNPARRRAALSITSSVREGGGR